MKPALQILPGLLVVLLAFIGIAAVSLGPAREGHTEDGFPDFFPTPTPAVTPPPKPAVKRVVVVGGVSGDRGQLTSLAGAGCAGAIVPGGDADLSLMSGGRVRTLRVHMPASAVAGKRLPVVLDFHALASSGAIEEALSGLLPLSDREGFLLVSPDGTGSPTGWNALLIGDPAVDDIRFVDDLITFLNRQFCTDPGQDPVCGTGHVPLQP